jgi:AcrR family transcriptional regulator
VSGRTGRRRAGASDTREAILSAARNRFASQGYDGATIRAIAADATSIPPWFTTSTATRSTCSSPPCGYR